MLKGKHVEIIVFLTGMSVMSAEMASSRLIAPYFGTSLFVWTNLIGIIMLFLTAGYYIGGRIADRKPSIRVMANIAFVTGAYFAALPFIIKPVMKGALSAIESISTQKFYAWLLASIIITAIPMLWLGMISPLAVRIKSKRVKEVGSVSGRIYALGTAGSIIGTFIPALVSIPLAGTKNTFVAIGAIMMASAVPGMKKKAAGVAATAVVAFLVLLSPGIKAEPGLVHEDESAYNYIQLVKEGNTIFLKLNEGNAYHSEYNAESVFTGSVWDYFLILPRLKSRKNESNESMLIIGLAGGTISRQYNMFYPEIEIQGVEIDKRIIELAEKYMGLKEQNTKIYIGDGRTFLEGTRKEYNYIIIDAYRQPYIPFHLTTVEFFKLARKRMTPDGILALNLGATSRESKLYRELTNTIAEVYENVYSLDVPNTFNHIIIASMRPLKVREGAEDIRIEKMLRYADRSMRKIEHDSDEEVFTDDRAPVELLTDLMIIKYVSEEGQGSEE